MAQIIIAAEDESGHRREYIALFRNLFEAAGVASETRALDWKDAFSNAILFSPMLEEHSVKFVIVALVRALIGRRSVALLFRATEAARSRQAKHRLRRLSLRLLRVLPASSVLTILPFGVDPAFAAVAKDWIYDPQLWDLTADAGTADENLAALTRQFAAGRKIVVALGAQNEAKGFDYLAEIWSVSSALRERMLFVAAGKVSAASKAAAVRFAAEGGVLIDRFVSDAELRGLYGAADLIWSCYAPFYDQASGIFGRAVQLGQPAIIREGSQVARLAELLDHPVILAPWGEAAAVAAGLAVPRAREATRSPTLVADFRSRSLSALDRALGLRLEVAG